ncbi:phage major capsid protein [Glaciimonas sp. PAMC28666]|uniref:phage major capsid protein n=1 Tax=Glaciimonas sp. PAMC28666 TaxID=2807626 RepID=UPI0019643A88|nr:phage major capsid protein [Glaciimonas sp. PAMC28666]QRX82245.1 phage major capsid protein [Glaciimonas sp. PAMC28666]
MKTTYSAFVRSIVSLFEPLYAMLFIYMQRTGLLLAIGPDDDNAAITTELQKISDQVKEQGEKAFAEARKSGDMSLETKTKVDELLVKQGELQARLQEAEQKLDRRSAGDQEQSSQSIGQQVSDSQEFKDYVSAGNYRKGFNFPIKAVVSITSDPSSAGSTIAPDRRAGIIAAPDRRLTVRDLLTPGTTNSNLIQYVRETGFQNMAATVVEGTAKPKSDIAFDLVAQAVVKIAHYVKASTEILSDSPMLQSYIDGRLRYGLALKEEGQLLHGSGIGNNLNGIYTQAVGYAAPIAVANATRIDVLRLALLQSELAEYPSTGIVMHPSDWAAIELQKDTTGAYIFANPQNMAQPALWGRPVVGTQAMAVNSFLVGAFKLGAQIFDRMQASVAVATENEDDFIKNMVAILIEERLGLAVYRPEAFIKGEMTVAP